ncbi:MAG TPA: ABC transporter permease, partial [Egibacteraceae bacterium]|nr:ABC transporter permease [Egibacteraceae bacterium]
MSRARAVLAIAALALRRLARDRLGLLFTVALPFTVILLVGLAFGDEGGEVRLGVAFDGAPSAEAERLAAALEARDGLLVVRLPDAATLRADVREGDVDAGLLIPPGTGTRPVLVGPADGGGMAAARPLVGAVLARLADPAAEPAPVRVERFGEDAPLGDLPRFGYTAPANLVLFTFITSLGAASGLIESRVIGTRRRLRAAPLSAGHVLAGEAFGRLLVAVAQALVVVLGAALIFGVAWGDPAGVTAVVGAFALVATAAGLLLGTVLRTPQQASAIGPMAGIALGMLGGCMWPLEIVPPAMRAAG